MSARLTGSAPLHVACGIDERYARPAGVLLTSLLACNSGLPFVFHLFCLSLRPADRQRFEKLAETENAAVRLHEVDPASLPSLPAGGHYSPAMYLRLLMPSVLAPATDRFLYLDSDILCLGRLDALAALDLGGRAVAAVPDIPATAAERARSLPLPHGRYFNSGVLWIDAARWNSERISERALDALAADSGRGRFTLMDQDALNVVVDGDFTELDPAWNRICDLGRMSGEPPADTVFLHYTGLIKPWRQSGRSSLGRPWRELAAQSPWAGEALLAPAGYQELEICARLALRAGEPAAAALWYGRYLREKFGGGKK